MLTTGLYAITAEKLEQAEGQLAHSGRTGAFYLPTDKKKDDSQLAKISHDSTKTSVEQVKDIASLVRGPTQRSWNANTDLFLWAH
jgi:COP9 signalosome complex subunit 5